MNPITHTYLWLKSHLAKAWRKRAEFNAINSSALLLELAGSLRSGELA